MTVFKDKDERGGEAVHESLIKEELSISYMTAVSAAAGISFDLQRHDEDSTDAELRKTIVLDADKNERFNAGLRVQLKATSSPNLCQDCGGTIKYVLKAKNYNDLCCEATTPIILALLILPEDKAEWLKWTSEDLLIKGVMYWANFQGQERTSNTGSVTVEIDKKHKINSDTLQDLLERLAKEDWP